VSLCVARQNQRWNCTYKNEAKVTVDVDDFNKFSEGESKYRRLYDGYLQDVTEIFYEEPPEETCRKLAEVFDLDPFEPKTDLIKTNPVDLSLIVENYDEVREYDINPI
jgi:hypothetical protein